jgi:hypothetical protein
MKTTHALLAFVTTLLPLVPLACSGNGAGKVTGTGDGGSTHASSGGGSSGGESSGGSGGPSSSGGGDDAEANGSSSGGQGASSSGAGEGGATGEGGASSSSGGTVVPVPDGGAPSTPMMVTCGATSCDTGGSMPQQCCVSGDGGTCTAFTTGCSSGITVPCDEAADCTGGSVCCQVLECGQHSTSCKTTCATTDFQLCRTDSECGTTSDAGAAKKCIVQMCGSSLVGPTCGGTMVKVEACAYPAAGVGFGSPTTWGPLPECTAE